ncbi:MAG: hypothetical protein RL328_1989 [Acidobacteriota bacterium]
MPTLIRSKVLEYSRRTLLLALVLSAFPGKPHTARDRQVGLGRMQILKQYLEVPLVFERTDSVDGGEQRYVARGVGYNVALSPQSALVHVDEFKEQLHGTSELKITFAESNQAASLAGLEPGPGVSNYYIGSDPARWRHNVPHYAKVVANELYPGIDAVYYGNHRQLEYDLVVKPKADPSAIRLRFEGQRELSLNVAGDVVAAVGTGSVIAHPAPSAGCGTFL